MKAQISTTVMQTVLYCLLKYVELKNANIITEQKRLDKWEPPHSGFER